MLICCIYLHSLISGDHIPRVYSCLDSPYLRLFIDLVDDNKVNKYKNYSEKESMAHVVDLFTIYLQFYAFSYGCLDYLLYELIKLCNYTAVLSLSPLAADFEER